LSVPAYKLLTAFFNETVDLIATTEVGPNIVRFGFYRQTERVPGGPTASLRRACHASCPGSQERKFPTRSPVRLKNMLNLSDLPNLSKSRQARKRNGHPYYYQREPYQHREPHLQSRPVAGRIGTVGLQNNVGRRKRDCTDAAFIPRTAAVRYCLLPAFRYGVIATLRTPALFRK